MSIFEFLPEGIQPSPAEARLSAAGARVKLREINFGSIHDKADLMLAFANGLSLPAYFGHNWDALRDMLSDPGILPERYAIVLCDYPQFVSRRPKLAAVLQSVLLDAQAAQAAAGHSLWLLSGLPESRSPF